MYICFLVAPRCLWKLKIDKSCNVVYANAKVEMAEVQLPESLKVGDAVSLWTRQIPHRQMNGMQL